MKVGILSLGCKVNMYESDFVITKLKEAGFTICDFSDICDVYIINTCTVTNTSDVKSRKMIRSAIRRNPDACVIAMGCFIEANKDFDIEGLDIVVGNKDKSRIVDLINEYMEKKKKIRDLYDFSYTDFEDMQIKDFIGRTRAFVKVQDGCENYCSYCIIPYVRGKCRSKDMDKVIEEVHDLVSNGYQEVVLTGIHTGNYGQDKSYHFADLLNELVKIKGLKRLRISSIEITELTDEVLSVLERSPVIVDHLHIPLQSGSDEVLKKMNRKYDMDYYFKKIEKIKSIRKDISITTDIIIGFPTEERNHFEQTLENAKKIGFSKIHVFPFSLRSGTKAEEFENIVPDEEKKKRSKELLMLSKELEIKYMNQFLNKRVEVLIENSKGDYSDGHTSNYLHVRIEKKLSPNTFYQVRLTKVIYPYMIGEIE